MERTKNFKHKNVKSLEKNTIKGMDRLKYLGIILANKATSEDEIKQTGEN